MLWFTSTILILVGALITWQDLKTRLINLWLIVVFAAINFLHYLLLHPICQFLENSAFCIIYFLFCYLVLLIFYYLKNKRFEKIIDSKIGLGDVLIFLSIGCSIDPLNLVPFFTLSFIISIIIHLIFIPKNTIPLVGIILPCYFFYLFAFPFGLF